ncbi:uncharacterized protein NPIL_390172 [Nephila pilipes]|uniref:Uncharacterized protein n=1 Tax=Nephila pilipes TaxID=299642 RepID=A0A8X6US86_NEPPI|nr:uncharacterized protein NPIL_390172 [Nephila pilipes]
MNACEDENHYPKVMLFIALFRCSKLQKWILELRNGMSYCQRLTNLFFNVCGNLSGKTCPKMLSWTSDSECISPAVEQYLNNTLTISLEAYAGKIDKIVSWNAFQQIHRKERALENVYHMLKPGGHVGMWFYLNNPEYSWPWKMKSTGKWDQYQTDPLLPYHPGTSDTKYYEETMQEIGFRDVQILVQSKPILYRDDRECLDKSEDAIS